MPRALQDHLRSELENEVAVLKKKVAVNETARHNADDEVVQLRSDTAFEATRVTSALPGWRNAASSARPSSIMEVGKDRK
jgi:hypothetical protein